VANQVTLPRVEANQNYASHYAVLAAFGLADSSTAKSEIEELYLSRVKELPARPISAASAYSAEIDGTPYLAVKITNPGLWGPITAILAADPPAERILGFEILEQQETPGLGGRIGEAWFTEQFKGEKVSAEGRVIVAQGTGKGDPDPENSRVDAVTGAAAFGLVQISSPRPSPRERNRRQPMIPPAKCSGRALVNNPSSSMSRICSTLG